LLTELILSCGGLAKMLC